MELNQAPKHIMQNERFYIIPLKSIRSPIENIR